LKCSGGVGWTINLPSVVVCCFAIVIGVTLSINVSSRVQVFQAELRLYAEENIVCSVSACPDNSGCVELIGGGRCASLNKEHACTPHFDTRLNCLCALAVWYGVGVLGRREAGFWACWMKCAVSLKPQTTGTHVMLTDLYRDTGHHKAWKLE